MSNASVYAHDIVSVEVRENTTSDGGRALHIDAKGADGSTFDICLFTDRPLGLRAGLYAPEVTKEQV